MAISPRLATRILRNGGVDVVAGVAAGVALDDDEKRDCVLNEGSSLCVVSREDDGDDDDAILLSLKELVA